MMTLDELKALPLTYTIGFCGEKSAHRAYRNAEHGIQKEVITPRLGGKWGTPKVYFYIDGDKREFRTIEALHAALQEKS